MLALLMGLMLSVNVDPSRLTVPILPDPKEVWIEALHQCENPDNVKCIVDTNGKLSCGAFMFQEKTWLSFGKKFGATRENIYDPDLQRIVVRDMLDKGFKNQWYWCSRAVEKSLGAYPR